MPQTREGAVTALAAALEQITLANGYPIEVKSVKREFRTLDDLDDDELPILFVEDDGLDNINLKSESGDITFPVSVIGFMKKTDSELITTTINKLDNSVIKAATAQDPPLGGAATDALPANSRYRSGSRAVDYGAFIRPINITYKARLDAGL